MERGIIAWSDKKYDIRDFAELFYDRLPLIARVEELNDNDAHDIRPNSQSVYLVHSVHLQPRIVTRTEQNDEQFVTFPNSYPFKFHVVRTDGSISEPLTVNGILNYPDQDPKGTRIRMAHREELTLSDIVTCDIFGTLVIGGTYNEKYLLVIRLTPEGPLSNDFRLTALPTYKPFLVTLPLTTDGRLENYLEEYQRELKASVSAASYEENTEELLIFSHPPNDDEYEMVFPSTFITVTDLYDKPNAFHRQESVVEDNEENPTNLPARGQDNEFSQQLSEITSSGFEKRDDSPENTAPDECSFPVQPETIYEDVPGCSSSQSSDTTGVQDDDDKGKDEHVYESYIETPESLLAEEASEPPPLPAKHLVGKASEKLCTELRLNKDPRTVDDPSGRQVRPTDHAPLWETTPDRPNSYHSRETRVNMTFPRLPKRPSLKTEKPPKSAIANDRSSETLDQNKANKSSWYRFRLFRRRTVEKRKTIPGLRKFGGDCAEPSSDYCVRTELQSETLTSIELHQPLRKSSSSGDRCYDKVKLSGLRNIISRRCKAADNAQTPSVVADITNCSALLVPSAATANEIRNNQVLRADKRTALQRNQMKDKTTAENPIRLEHCQNQEPMREKISNCNSETTDPPSLETFQEQPKFDRDSGFACDQSYCDNPRLILAPDSPMNCNKERPVVFTSLVDVPTDLSSLTVSGVASCLHLLNLGQYIHLFREQDVDGDLLICLDLDILMQDFGLKRFDAIKLSKFVRDGWRPRTKPENQV